MNEFITITPENIASEHICCAFSDKKCSDGYQKKKNWLKKVMKSGYRFYRLNERAKVFIEYGPSETAWLPVTAENYYTINCFWVSGKYKGHGYGKKLLGNVESEAAKNRRDGLYTVTGKKKFHFMSDGKWFIKQGFEIVDETENGFILLVKKLTDKSENPRFNQQVKSGLLNSNEKGYSVYYSNRCPFTEYHVNVSLKETAESLGLPLTVHKIESLKDAQNAPVPATIFSLFRDGEFITTDLSICMENRFRKFFGIS